MERLQKVMAHAGVASRRKAEEMILEGRVTVNGAMTTELGTKVGHGDEITVDGMPITNEQVVYALLYKPRGVVSTASDEKGRQTVVDILDELDERVYPVGRLDYDTSGLLLMTNDGEMANRLTHPKYGIEKQYVARVTGIPNNEDLKKLRIGVEIDGKKTAPAKVNLMSSDPKRQIAIVSLTIHEGKNHQVKNMFEAIGHPVEKLKRERYANLTLDGLTPGEWRPLRTEEVRMLQKMTHMEENK